MKVLQIRAPGTAVFSESRQPEPRGNEVLLRVCRVGFCGSDLNTYRGLNPLVTYPRVPGHEIAGEIIARGADVPETLKNGQLVTVLPYTACGRCSACRSGRSNACRDNETLGVQRDGAFSEFLALPWDKVVQAPGLSALELSLVEPLSVGFHAVDRGRVEAKDTVLVFGCGMIGLGTIAAAALERRANVIAVDIDDTKLALARECGASHCVNSRSNGLKEAVLDLTNGEGAGVTFEAVGSPITFKAAVQLAASAGRVVYIGYAKEPVCYETKDFITKELDILGSRNATRSDFDRAIQMLKSGRYPAGKTVTITTPFEQSGAVLDDWSRNPAVVTKIHVTF